MWETPLAEAIRFSPATAPENVLLALSWRGNISPATVPETMLVRHTSVGNPKRKVWWVQQQVFPQYETKVYRTSRKTRLLRRCWWRSVVRRNTRDSGANVEPAQHNQSTLPQLNSEVVNLTGLLKTKRLTYRMENDVCLHKTVENNDCSRLYFRCKRMYRGPQFTSGVSPIR